jgi:secreted Zn-dependent insulinase-like peptidase
VFSGVKQIDGQTGLLFGVQSPSASAAQLIAHIDQFLSGLPNLLQQLDDSTLASQQQALAAQFQSAVLPCAQAAELLWQSKLAGHPSDYLEQLSDAIMRVDREQLMDAVRQLTSAESARYCLTNGACPGEPWHAVP